MGEKLAGIYKAIIAVSREIVPIAKEQENKTQKFMFRGIDDVYNMLQPLMSKHGIFTTSEIIERTEHSYQTSSNATWHFVVLKMRYHFWAEDGSSVHTETVGEGADGGDKASNKAMAIADKYALIQMFKIPTKDMCDPDADTPPEQVVDKAPKQQQPPATQQPPAGDPPTDKGKPDLINGVSIDLIPFGPNKGIRWDSLAEADLKKSIDFFDKLIGQGQDFTVDGKVYSQQQATRIVNHLKILVSKFSGGKGNGKNNNKR